MRAKTTFNAATRGGALAIPRRLISSLLMSLLLSLLLSLLVGLLSSCGPGGFSQANFPGSSGSLSSITVGLPDTSNLGAEQKKLLNGFRLLIEPLDASCPRATTLDMTRTWTAGTFTQTVAQGCDYSIGMELGSMSDGPSSSSQGLDSVYFSNIKGPRDAEILRKDAIAGKTSVAMKINLKVTQVGVAAGFGSGSQMQGQVTPESGNGFGPGDAGDFDWRKVLQTVDVPLASWNGNDHGSAFYRDVMTHSGRKYTSDTPTTNAHETQHFLNSEVRNKTGAPDNTIYVGDGKAGLVLEPKMHAREVRNYVPPTMKQASRYDLYIIKQVDGDWSEVLYIFDEWSGYRADVRVAVELKRAGKLSVLGGEVCVGDGAAEFLHFGASAVAALKEKEPAYLQDQQFKAAFAMLAEESVSYIKEGAGDGVIDCQASRYLELFAKSPEAERNRQVIREWMGPVWSARVLGF